jgi:hypothetical protein
MGASARTYPATCGRMAVSAQTQGHIRIDVPMRPRERVCVRADALPPPRQPALDVTRRGYIKARGWGHIKAWDWGHIKAWGWGHIKGGNSFLPFPITNSKVWPYLICHSCLPRLWLVEVGAINFASTVLPTCKEVRVTFML